MHLFELVFIVVLATAAVTTHDHHGHGYSYSTKHEEQPHYEHHYGGQSESGGDGGDGGGDGGADGEGHGHHEHYHDHHPKYTFDYGVKDSHTGDHKNQWESRDGDLVKGGYTLHQPDGKTRIVEYTSDKHHGFNAEVKYIGHAHHPQVYGQDNHNNGQDNHNNGHHGHASSYASLHLHNHH